jgi:hypothetical protein
MRLYLFHLGRTSSGSPAPGYLIQTDDGQNILVDSGFPRGMVGTEPPVLDPRSQRGTASLAQHLGSCQLVLGW